MRDDRGVLHHQRPDRPLRRLDEPVVPQAQHRTHEDARGLALCHRRVPGGAKRVGVRHREQIAEATAVLHRFREPCSSFGEEREPRFIFPSQLPGAERDLGDLDGVGAVTVGHQCLQTQSRGRRVVGAELDTQVVVVAGLGGAGNERCPALRGTVEPAQGGRHALGNVESVDPVSRRDCRPVLRPRSPSPCVSPTRVTVAARSSDMGP